MKTLNKHIKKNVHLSIILFIIFIQHISGFADDISEIQNTSKIYKDIVETIPNITKKTDKINKTINTQQRHNSQQHNSTWISGLIANISNGLTYRTSNLHGCVLRNTSKLPLTVLNEENNAPEFVEGIITTRSIEKNAYGGIKIGDAVSATDIDKDTLRYSMEGPDAAFFFIDTTTGQLITKSTVDYSTKSSYYLTLTVTDGVLTDDIIVIVEVIPNRAPEFTAGDITFRTIAVISDESVNLGDRVTATDADNDPLTYQLSGGDAQYFSVDVSTGQLKTIPNIDYTTKPFYYLKLTVSDGLLLDEIAIIIDILLNSTPVFTEGELTIRAVAENTPAGVYIGTAVTATDAENDRLTYSLGGIDGKLFGINVLTGQLKTKTPLDYEKQRVYIVQITVTDNSTTNNINVIIEIINRDDIRLVSSIVPVSDRTPEVRDAIMAALDDVDSPEEVTEIHLATIPELMLRDTGITELKTGDFSGMTGLTDLNLYDNDLTELPLGIFEGLISLNQLRLGKNRIDPIPLIVSIQKIGESVYRAFLPTAAPFDIRLPIEVTDGIISSGISSVTIPKGSLNSISFTVIATGVGYNEPHVDIVALPKPPINHYGYVIAKSNVCNRSEQVADAITALVHSKTDCFNVSDVDLATITSLNLDNLSIRSLKEEDFSGMFLLRRLTLSNNQLMILPNNLFAGLVSLRELDLSGNPVEPLELTVLLDQIGQDMFRIVVPTGAPFDMVLPLVVNNGRIIDGISEVRLPIGSIESQSFTVTRTPNTLDAVTVDVGELPNIPQLHKGYSIVKGNEYPMELIRRINMVPVFTDGKSTTRSIQEYTEAGVNIGNAITATDGNGDALTYSLKGPDADSFDIDSSSGQLRTKVPLDYNNRTTYSVEVFVSDGYGGTAIINVTIEVIDLKDNQAPVFTEGSETTRSVNENTDKGENIGSPVSATDEDNDTITYSIDGEDADDFSIDKETGQLRTNIPLDYENQSTYTVVISVSDGINAKQFISVKILVVDIDETPINHAPVFTEGATTSRLITENQAQGTDVGMPVSATDEDNDTLSYTISGKDAKLFTIDNVTGQLKTGREFNYEDKNSYSVVVTVSDGELTAATEVEIRVTDINDPPSYSVIDSLRLEYTVNTIKAETEIGPAIAAKDEDKDTLTYSLSGVDATRFKIDSKTGQLITKEDLDFEKKSVYTVVVTASDGKGGKASIIVFIGIPDTNENPIFVEGNTTTRTIVEKTASGVNIGTPVTATDVNNDLLYYTLGGPDASSFSIDNTTGQLKTNVWLDYDTKSTYSITISVSDNNGGMATIAVTIYITDANDPPIFDEGNSTSRTVPENTSTGVDIGDVVSASDRDSSTLTYILGGTDADSFDIESSTGQLKTKNSLDFETKSSYTVIITVSDDSGGIDTIDVNIRVTDINDTPFFNEGSSTTRSIAENTVVGINIGNAVSATDQDGDNLTYSLSGADANAFDIESSSGQLKTKISLDFENKSLYSVIVNVNDGNQGFNTIVVSIYILDVNEIPSNYAPVFTEGISTNRSVEENTLAGVNIGNPVSATDRDSTLLNYGLSGPDASAFSIDTDTGQLKTNTALNYEIKSVYTVRVTVSDGNRSDSITVTINITDANDDPMFNAGNSTRLTVPENTNPGINIGDPVSATDEDEDPLIYSLIGPDVSSFEIETNSGQLKTKDSLDFEQKSLYSVSVEVTDNLGGTDSIDVSIYVSDVNDLPVFSEENPTTRSIPENTEANINIGPPVSATDDDDVSLTYTLGGTDVDSFDIDSSSGQLKTKENLDHEESDTRSVSVEVTDNNGGNATIDVTINISDENDPPIFTDQDPTTRTIAENTGVGFDIGGPVSATDQDGDTLTYTLSGTHADHFDIDETSGQLKTLGSLDYEETSSYSVIVTVNDNRNGSDTINVTIEITDIAIETSLLAGRTQQVQDAIVDAIPDVTSVFEVTETHLANIMSLDVSLQEISSLQQSDFNGLTSLISLNLSDNDLTSLPAGIFDSLTTLTSLDLSSNELDDFSSDIFDALTSLETLDLSSNDIDHLSSDIFAELTMLTLLDLSSNELSSLLSTIFDTLLSLACLDLSNNGITMLVSTIFDELTSLTKLDLSSNELSSLPSTIFDELSSLTSLNLSENGFTSFPDAAEDITTLTSLNFSGNELGSLTVGMFDGLTSLTELILSDIGISSIPTGFFNTLTQLISLNMSDNPISSLAGTTFSQLSSLETLDLYGNQLNSLPDGIFVGLVSLQILNVDKGLESLFSIGPILEKVEDGKFKAVVSTGAPFNMDVLIDVVGGATVGFDHNLTIPVGESESEVLTVIRSSETATNAVSVFIVNILGLESGYSGFGITYSRELVEILPAAGSAPGSDDIRMSNVPTTTALLPNFPNPFNPETWIPFQLAKPSSVTITIYNMRGEVVRQFAMGRLKAGRYTGRNRAAYWDGRNDFSEKVASGAYFSTFKAGKFISTRKMMLRK